jgi:hypothetical protein
VVSEIRAIQSIRAMSFFVQVLNALRITLKGRDYSTHIWQGQGRFFPLGYQEFNLLRHFTDTITGYHVPPIAQLLIFSWILLILDDELSVAARVARQ